MLFVRALELRRVSNVAFRRIDHCGAERRRLASCVEPLRREAETELTRSAAKLGRQRSIDRRVLIGHIKPIVENVEAADALANGLNPYTEAVEVANGAPNAEPGDVITGYVYPPVTAIFYALGQWTLSDPRYTSLFAWILVLTLVGLTVVKERRLQNLYLMLLLAALPGWPLVLRAAWTEPLSLAFLAMAFFLWRRPVASGIGLGLALASKQYFVVSAPLALLHRDQGWRKRITLAAIVIAVTVGVALVWDTAAFWSSAIEFHTTTEARTDGSNIVGLLAAFNISWAPPTVVTLGAGLAAASIAGRVSRSRRSFVLAMGLTLAVSFLVSSQAFANYWFLIFGLGVLGLAASPIGQDSTNEPGKS